MRIDFKKWKPEEPLTKQSALRIKEKTKELVMRQEAENRARFSKIPPRERRKMT